MLRATTACTFSTSQLLKVLRVCCAFSFFTCTCASRHKSVQFFISHLARLLRTRRFSAPNFRPSGAPKHWKNTVFRDFPTFSRTWIFFLLTVSSLIFFLLLFSSLLFSDSSNLCFSSVHTVGSLTSNFLRPAIWKKNRGIPAGGPTARMELFVQLSYRVGKYAIFAANAVRAIVPRRM